MCDARAQRIHDIATKHAQAMVREAAAAGLPWSDIVFGAETVVAILVGAAAQMSTTPNRSRFATEMVDALTERAP